MKTFKQFIDHGKVACPSRATDVEVFACIKCPWLVDSSRTAHKPYIRCRPVMQRPNTP
jgi:hypothetical protein